GYGKAIEYAEHGLELITRCKSPLSPLSRSEKPHSMEDYEWKEFYSETVELKRILCRARFLNGHHLIAEEICKESISHCRTNQDLAKFYKLLASIEAARQQHDISCKMQEDILSLYGITFEHSLESYQQTIREIHEILNGSTLEEAF